VTLTDALSWSDSGMYHPSYHDTSGLPNTTTNRPSRHLTPPAPSLSLLPSAPVIATTRTTVSPWRNRLIALGATLLLGIILCVSFLFPREPTFKLMNKSSLTFATTVVTQTVAISFIADIDVHNPNFTGMLGLAARRLGCGAHSTDAGLLLYWQADLGSEPQRL
jgi:hypothetical protein